MKIAVCMSGESRTWKIAAPSIINFFKSQNHEVKFFGHTWAMNSWKTFDNNGISDYEHERLDQMHLKEQLQKTFNFEKLVVDPPYTFDISRIEDTEVRKNPEHCIGWELAANYIVPRVWSSLFNSQMQSNFLKQEYEIENNMQFDFVVKCRFDIAYHPSVRFENYLPTKEMTFKNGVYASLSTFRSEFNLPVIDDVIYFGSSPAMDLLETVYRVYQNADFFNMVKAGYYDPAYKVCGPNVILHKWATMKNILICALPTMVYYAVVRREFANIDPCLEYDKLHEATLAWGKQ